MAITILGLVCAPICSSLVLAARVNQRSSQVMAAQLSVSNAVEQLMAEGITEGKNAANQTVYLPTFDGVTVEVTGGGIDAGYYAITVYDGTDEADAIVVVNTVVRATPAEGGGT